MKFTLKEIVEIGMVAVLLVATCFGMMWTFYGGSAHVGGSLFLCQMSLQLFEVFTAVCFSAAAILIRMGSLNPLFDALKSNQFDNKPSEGPPPPPV